MRGVLLGPQRVRSSLREAVERAGLSGPVALVTAGWQEREEHDELLHAQLGDEVVNLELYERGDRVFEQDPELARLHRARQEQLRQRQDYYRFRLTRTIDAALDVERLSKGSACEADERQWSMDIIRKLDEDHVERCRAIREEFDAKARPLERDGVAREREQLRALLGQCRVLAIAGGHVAVLLNRLRLFGISELLDGQALVAWSGGAMVTGERVVLFHESPPQGQGVSEVLDEGLGLHRGILPLPSPRLRLRLDDTFRVGWMAQRNLPTKCIAFDNAEYVRFDGARWFGASGTSWLRVDGTVSAEWAS